MTRSSRLAIQYVSIISLFNQQDTIGVRRIIFDQFLFLNVREAQLDSIGFDWGQEEAISTAC
jgi:hypothetical protein